MSEGPRPLLKPKFQIGSIHGRHHYQQDERVFHRDDVPLKAKQARREIELFLQPQINLSQAPGWNNDVMSKQRSGKAVSVWDEPAQSARQYHVMEAKHRLKREAKRKAEIRNNLLSSGLTNSSGVSWQSSTELPPPHVREKSWKKVALPGQKKAIKVDRPSLLQREAMRLDEARAEKRAARDTDLSKTFTKYMPSQYLGNTIALQQNEGINDRGLDANGEGNYNIGGGGATDRSMTLENQSSLTEITAQVFTPEVLQEYMENQNEVTPAQARRERTLLRNSFKPKKARSPVHKGVGMGVTPLPKGGKLKPKEAKVSIAYEHRGKYQQSPFDDYMAWSCCMNEEKDSRGCVGKKLYDYNRWNLE